MVNILDRITIGSIEVIVTDVNPASNGGVDVPVGTFGTSLDGSGLFLKTGSSITDWYKMVQSNDNALSNILEVSKYPQAGQFATIEDALNSITTNSSTNPFIIKVGVGIFLENQLNVKPYVSIVGTSIQSTIVKPIGNNNLFHITDVMTEISFMSIQEVPAGYIGIYCHDSGDYFQGHKLNFIDCDTTVQVTSVTQDTVVYLEYCDINGTYTTGLSIIATNGFKSFINAENFYTFSSTTGSTAVNVTGPGSVISLTSAALYGTESPEVAPVIGTYGIVFQNGAMVKINTTTYGSFDYATVNNNTGVGSFVEMLSAHFDENINDFIINHPNTTGSISGVADITKITINPSSTVNTAYQQSSGNGSGMVVTGPIYNGAKESEVAEISTLIKNQSIGLMSGGNLVLNTGLNIQVNAGLGYIIDATVLKKYTWANTVVALTASVENFIYVNHLGVITVGLTEVDALNNIILGSVLANASGVEFINATPLRGNNLANAGITMFKEVFGALFKFGCVVTENATAYKLDITAGKYYYGSNEYNPVSGTAINFTKVYSDGASGWTFMTPTDIVPSDKYDDGSGTLANLTSSYYAKHLLFVGGDGANQKYYLVYDNEQYITINDAVNAQLPIFPEYFHDSIVMVSSIIVRQGTSNITQILSQRPFPLSASANTTTTSDHLSLSNLTSGNAGHTQFMMLNGTTAMTGDINMSTNNVTNAGTYNGIIVETHMSRHLPNGSDALTTAAPTTNLGGSSTNAIGIQNSFSRSDHSHAINIADTSTTGLLTNTDWNTFNNKQNTLTASNGLTLSSSDIKLGGTLIQNTTIDGAFSWNTGATTPLTLYSVYTGSLSTITGQITVSANNTSLNRTDNTTGRTDSVGVLNTGSYMWAYNTASVTDSVSISCGNTPGTIANNGANNFLVVRDTSALKGIVYSADYSANFTPESLITKRYSDIIRTAVLGGTGQSTYTTGDMIYASAANTLSKLPIGTNGQVLKVVAGIPAWATDTTVGTVTTVSVVTNQGVSGSVATDTTTPAITLTLGALTGVTSINGLVITANTATITTGIWNGTAIIDTYISSATNWNTAYTNMITSLTTTGSSGAATLTSNVLNIPNYTLAGLGGQPLNTNLTSVSGLTFVSTSFVKMTAAGTFTLDTNTYLTANQSITLSGDVTGTGTTSITTSITATTVTGKVLTGYVSGAGIVADTDTILQAFQKLNGNITALNLQTIYNGSTTPEILTDATRGALTIKRGSVSDTDALLQLQTGAGVTSFSINASGDITAGTWNGGVIGVTYGGTGTATNFTQNSIVFAGASGVYTEDTSFTYNTTTKQLALSGTDTTILMAGITTEPTAPAAGNLLLYSKSIAGRMMPKWVAPSGVDNPIQSGIFFNNVSIIAPGSAASLTGFGVGLTAVGTISNPALTTTSMKTQSRRFAITSVGTAGALSSLRIGVLECWRGNATGLGGFFVVARFSIDTLVAGNRMFVGLTDTATTAPTNIDPTTSTTPGKIGMAINTNTGNWNIVHNITGTAPTVIALGASFPVNTTSMYELVLFAAPNSATVGYRVTNLTTNAQTSGTISTNLPASTTFMGRTIWMTNNATASAVAWSCSRFGLETDY
jgi:hypothetical protein